MKFRLMLLVVFICNAVFSQQAAPVAEKGRIFEYRLDYASRYLWRGQCWGGPEVAVQPTITYKGIDDWEFGFWATKNHANTNSFGYQEIDFSVLYCFNDFTFVQVSDYYWPSVEHVAGEKDSYFNYGPDGVKTVDLSFNIDRTEEPGTPYPCKVTISTLIAGRDFRYDLDDITEENPRQNFTTYIEFGYKYRPFKNKGDKSFLKTISLDPVIGAVLNNNAKYYSYADYDMPSLCNMGIAIIKEFKIGARELKIPVSLNYTHNAATENTDDFGKNFLVATLSFEY